MRTRPNILQNVGLHFFNLPHCFIGILGKGSTDIFQNHKALFRTSLTNDSYGKTGFIYYQHYSRTNHYYKHPAESSQINK